MKLIVKSVQPMFRRCGMTFDGSAKEVEVTDEQAKILKSDKMLVCLEISTEKAAKK